MLVGLSGEAGVGKDTVADILVAEHGFCKIALADEIKRIAHRLYGFTREQLWGPSELRNTPSPKYPHLICRTVLQKLGTEVGREIDPNTWVNIVLESIELLRLYAGIKMYVPWIGVTDVWEDTGSGSRPRLDAPETPYKGFVVPDVRWPAGNEGTALRSREGKLVRVWRPGAGLAGESGKHTSETSIQVPEGGFDYGIDNTFETKDPLSRICRLMLHQFTGRVIPFDEDQDDVPPFLRQK